MRDHLIEDHLLQAIERARYQLHLVNKSKVHAEAQLEQDKRDREAKVNASKHGARNNR